MIGPRLQKKLASGRPGWCPFCNKRRIAGRAKKCRAATCRRAYNALYAADARRPTLLRVVERIDPSPFTPGRGIAVLDDGHAREVRAGSTAIGRRVRCSRCATGGTPSKND